MGRPRALRGNAPAALVLLAVLVAPSVLASAEATSPPVLPVADGSLLLSGLSAPVLAPGASGSLALVLSDPLAAPLLGLRLTVAWYEFNAYPGNATGPLPSDVPTLSAAGSSGPSVTLLVASLDSGASVGESVGVSTDAAAPVGTYALRLSVTFAANGTSYLFESRGFFSAAAWSAATSAPGGASTLNLSALGVSGVVPETAVLVRQNPYPPVLWAILAAAIVLAAAGGYVAWRPGPGSRSGASGPRPPSQAPRAFGKRRTRDGD